MYNLHKLYQSVNSVYQNLGAESIAETVHALDNANKAYESFSLHHFVIINSKSAKRLCFRACDMNVDILDKRGIQQGTICSRKQLRACSLNLLQPDTRSEDYYNSKEYPKKRKDGIIIMTPPVSQIYDDINSRSASIYDLNLSLNYSIGNGTDSDLFYNRSDRYFKPLTFTRIKKILEKDIRCFKNAMQKYPDVAYYGEKVNQYSQTALF